MPTRIDKSDIESAGNYLNRQLEQKLPGIYSKKYAQLWAEEGEGITSSATLEKGATSVIEEIVETVGEAKELSDLTGDVPTVTTSTGEFTFAVHYFVAGYQYSVLQLNAMQKAGRDIRPMQIMGTDRALRQKVHDVLVFGSSKRNTTGMYNNPDVPVNGITYDPNTATYQEHIDFVDAVLADIEDLNELTDSAGVLYVTNKLRRLWGRTYNTQGNKTVMQAIMETNGIENGGTIREIRARNENKADVLTEFGATGGATAGKDLIAFLPSDPAALERLYHAPDYLPPQLMGMNYKVVAYTGTSQAIWHYPEAASYVYVDPIA